MQNLCKFLAQLSTKLPSLKNLTMDEGTIFNSNLFTGTIEEDGQCTIIMPKTSFGVLEVKVHPCGFMTKKTCTGFKLYLTTLAGNRQRMLLYTCNFAKKRRSTLKIINDKE